MDYYGTWNCLELFLRLEQEDVIDFENRREREWFSGHITRPGYHNDGLGVSEKRGCKT